MNQQYAKPTIDRTTQRVLFAAEGRYAITLLTSGKASLVVKNSRGRLVTFATQEQAQAEVDRLNGILSRIGADKGYTYVATEAL